MVTHSHYDYEDTPPADGDTQIDMYRSARALTLDAPLKANAALDMIGAALEELYAAAESRNDQPAMVAINDAWHRTQTIVQHITHDAAALAGADVAIDTLREQREAIAHELSDIVTAIAQVDAENPRISELVVALRQDIEAFESEWATQVVYESFYANLCPLIKEVNPHANAHKRVDWFLQLLKGDRLMTPEQRNIIAAFLGTMGN